MKKYTVPRSTSVTLEPETPLLSVSDGDISNSTYDKKTSGPQLSNQYQFHSGLWDGMDTKD